MATKENKVKEYNKVLETYQKFCGSDKISYTNSVDKKTADAILAKRQVNEAISSGTSVEDVNVNPPEVATSYTLDTHEMEVYTKEKTYEYTPPVPPVSAGWDIEGTYESPSKLQDFGTCIYGNSNFGAYGSSTAIYATVSDTIINTELFGDAPIAFKNDKYALGWTIVDGIYKCNILVRLSDNRAFINASDVLIAPDFSRSTVYNEITDSISSAANNYLRYDISHMTSEDGEIMNLITINHVYCPTKSELIPILTAYNATYIANGGSDMTEEINKISNYFDDTSSELSEYYKVAPYSKINYTFNGNTYDICDFFTIYPI